MACFIIIFLYARYQVGYDNFHENKDRIYKLNRLFLDEDGHVNFKTSGVAPQIGPLLQQDFPNILQTGRMFYSSQLLSYKNKYFKENRFCYADPEILNIFSFQVINGNLATALSEPNYVILTEEMANKYFRDENPINKIIQFQSFDQKGELIVKGVIKNIPSNSRIRFDFLCSFKTYEYLAGQKTLNNWSFNNYNTYVLLPPNYRVNDFISKLDPFVEKHIGKDSTKWTKLIALKFIDIHKSEMRGYIYILLAIAGFVLLLSCINFINLSTAQTMTRLKEVGVRKVVGAARAQLFKQFIIESMLIAFCAFLISLILVEYILPEFNQLFYSNVSINFIEDYQLIFYLLGILMLTGFISGCYPALYISSFHPVKILKTHFVNSHKKSKLRKVLVILQFTISIYLIINIITISKQMDYVQRANLSFKQDHIVFLPMTDYIRNHPDIVKQELLQQINIENVTLSSRVPPGRLNDNMGAHVFKENSFVDLNFRIPYL